jgi:hypothetical protein
MITWFGNTVILQRKWSHWNIRLRNKLKITLHTLNRFDAASFSRLVTQFLPWIFRFIHTRVAINGFRTDTALQFTNPSVYEKCKSLEVAILLHVIHQIFSKSCLVQSGRLWYRVCQMVDISPVYWQLSFSNHPQWYIFMCTETRANAFHYPVSCEKKGVLSCEAIMNYLEMIQIKRTLSYSKWFVWKLYRGFST